MPFQFTQGPKDTFIKMQQKQVAEIEQEDIFGRDSMTSTIFKTRDMR